MSDLDNAKAQYEDDTSSVLEFANEIYDKNFADDFYIVDTLYDTMSKTPRKITDDELEEILTTLPLDMIHVSSSISELKLRREVVKLKNKETRRKLQKQITQDYDQSLSGYSATAKKAEIDAELTSQMVAYEILLSAYDAVIAKVEGKVSFSKEMIMSCKKVWDARRSAEAVPMGVAQEDTLPEYTGEQFQNNYANGIRRN